MDARPFGYLDDRDRARQAATFVALYRRNPSGEWQSAFDRWAGDKDFHPGDRHAIGTIVEEVMFSVGAVTATDPHYTPEAA